MMASLLRTPIVLALLLWLMLLVTLSHVRLGVEANAGEGKGKPKKSAVKPPPSAVVKEENDEQEKREGQAKKEQQDQDQERSLTWVGDKDGLMSHFLQLKIYHLLASTYSRQLYVSPIYSTHYNNRPIHMCDVFDLSNASPPIKCISLVEICSMKMSPVLLGSQQAHVCYKGPLPNIYAAANRKESVLRAMNLTNIPLKLSARYSPMISAVKKAMGANGKGNYTVAHWRRGDQLRTRCKASRDLSLNCGTAKDLITAIRKHSSDSIVYVATNEPTNSQEYQALQEAGFKLFPSVQAAATRANDNNEISGADTFALELALMLDCSTFLGWGLTEIKDVVEYERSRLHKSFCVADGQENSVVHTFETGTWCDVKSGVYKFKYGYSEKVWVVQNSTSVQATAGGVINPKSSNNVAMAFTDKAAGLAAGDSAHLAAAQAAQKGFFQPLGATKNNVITGTGSKNSGGPFPPQQVQRMWPESAHGSQNKRGRAHTEQFQPLPTSNVKVDPVALQYYSKILEQLRSTAMLPKKHFSDRMRVVAVAGLEGTGHHALADMLSVCMAESGHNRCLNNATLDALLCFFHHNGKTRSGLFNAEDSGRAGLLVSNIESTLQDMSRNLTQGNGHNVVFLGLGFTDGAGMMSYPNFGGAYKSINHPDVFLLASIAEKVGVDFRVLVLQRSATEVIQSVSSRGFGGPEESRILVDNAAALYSQLRLLDRKFFLCIDYSDLTIMKENLASPQVATKRAALASFLSLDQPLVDKMLKQVKSRPSAAQPRNSSDATANAALSEFQLESRIALIQQLCQAN